MILERQLLRRTSIHVEAEYQSKANENKTSFINLHKLKKEKKITKINFIKYFLKYVLIDSPKLKPYNENKCQQSRYLSRMLITS